jgi:ADP-heptose:LPS heptosyltransferase
MDKLGNPPPQRVAILRALQLGDLLCVVPALRALRAGLPQAEISLVGLPWARNFARRFRGYLDSFVEFPGFPGLPERTPQISQLPGFLKEMQDRHFDLVLQMQGSGAVTNPLVVLFGATRTAGFFLPGEYCPDEEYYFFYPDQLPELKRHLALLDYLGLPNPLGERLEFPLARHEQREFEAIAEKYGLEAGRFACVHAGSRASERRWPGERFAAVADGLAGRGFQVVLTGTGVEKELAASIIAQMRAPAIDLAGETSLGSFAALLSRASLIVCNDTGASHLADALCVPSVVLFTASDPLRWAPLDRRRHRVVESAANVSAGAILAEVDQMLEERVTLA